MTRRGFLSSMVAIAASPRAAADAAVAAAVAGEARDQISAAIAAADAKFVAAVEALFRNDADEAMTTEVAT